MTYYHLSYPTGNKKLGPIPAITAGRDTCPASCPLMGNGCYAENFPMLGHWDKVSNGERGVTLSSLVDKIRELPTSLPLRYGVAGDIPPSELHWAEICSAVGSRKLKAWCYTHRPYEKRIHETAVLNGMTVNYSCHSESEAIEHVKAGRPAAIVLESNVKWRAKAVRDDDGKLFGAMIMVCPQHYDKKVTCGSCMLCHSRPKDMIIGFPAHGSRKKAAEGTLQ